MGRRRRTALLGIGLAGIAFAAAGCGSEDFANDPRPPAPIEMSAKVGDDEVRVSPIRFDGKPVGAGLASVTIANLSDKTTELTFAGPDEPRTTNPIIANGVLDYKIDLRPGQYTVSAADDTVRPMQFTVGPERPSAQNDLLLP
jgi:hypothetical protein